LSLENEEIKICQHLVSLLIDNQDMTPSLDTACDWFRKYLRIKIERHWPLIQSCLKAVEASAESPSRKDFAVVVSFVHEVARKLVTEKDVALCDIVDLLANSKYFKLEVDKDDRVLPNQLVFAVTGWLRKSQQLRMFESKLIVRSPPL
jgi:hypothetical protein